MESITVQIEKSSIIRKLVAIILLITLTMVDFAFVGIETVSYAADALSTGTTTNNKNVTFDAFFKDASGVESASKEESIISKDMKLFVRVSVKNDGYFNGEVTLGESNFKIKNEVLSESINKIEENKITLNQINSGEAVEFELGIEPIKNDTISSEFLSMSSAISINGIYRNSEEKDINIDATRNVQLILTNPYSENDGLEITTQILTNKVLKIEQEDKRVVQVLVQSDLKGSLYPIKENKIELSVPEGTEKVDVKSRGTLGTNGKTENEFDEFNWDYNETDKKVNVTIKNEEQNGKIKWLKNGKDTLIVTYIMDAQKDIAETEMMAKDTMTLFDAKGTVKEATSSVKVGEEKDGIITTEIALEENSIYKGKIYSGENRDYKLKTNIFVNNSETGRTASIELKQARYELADGVMLANSQFSNTVLSKDNVLRILGEDGKLSIKLPDGTVIAEITKNTEADENGRISVVYPEEITAIKIETTEVKQAGTISLIHVKTIKEDGNSRETKNAYLSLIENSMEQEVKMTLKETSTATKLTLNKDNLSTLTENKGVEITATLKTNSEENDLFTNPYIKIELPSQVENVNINSVNLLYDEELKLASGNIGEENGRKVIEIALEGTQTKHKVGALDEGATIIINADLTLNKKATNSDEKIVMICTNHNTEATVSAEQPIQVVSPKGMITINNIEDYGMTTLGEEETKTAKLQLATEEKQTKVNIEVINNNEEKIKDVKVLGDFPTKNNENTMDTKVSGIEVSGIDAKVYYSENENATDDLTNGANGWKEEINNNASVKKYLIAVDSMDQSQDLIASYQLSIPQGLQYNEQASEGYTVAYQNENASNEVTATRLVLATGKGPEVKTEIKAKLGNEYVSNGAEVAQGEIIKYEVTAENTGSETATNIKATAQVPEGTVYVKLIDDFVYNEGYFTEVEDIKDITYTIDSLEPGAKITKSFEVKVKKQTEQNSVIVNKATATYGEAVAESEEITHKVVKGNLSVYVKREMDLSVSNLRGANLEYYFGIENITNETQKNVTVNLNIPKELVVTRIVKLGDTTEENVVEDSTTIKIDEIEPGKVANIFVFVQVGSIEDAYTKQIGITATAKTQDSKAIHSNEYIEVIKDYELGISLSANDENGYLKSEDIIDYTITVKNKSDLDSADVEIRDVIPNELTVKEISVDGEGEAVIDNNVIIIKSIPANGIVNAKIKTVVDYSELRTEPVVITNVAKVYYDGDVLSTSEEITHILQAEVEEDSNEPNNPNNPSSPNNPNNPNGTKNNNNTDKGLISGTVWVDANQDGQRDGNEKLLEGIRARLIDTQGNTVKNAEGKDIIATSNNKGLYMLQEIPQGEYIVVLEYDTSTYVTTAYQKAGILETKNSDFIAQKLVVDGQEENYAVTDIISVSDKGITNIDLGLMNATKFDLELNKYISKIVVQTSKETKTYEYDKTTLAKAEIAAKQLQGATVIIEYQLEVANTGEVAGYVKNIVDYMPSSLKFSSELNQAWYQSGTELYNSSLANTKIEAGETKVISLVLTKTMTEENTGLVNNKAEIAESYNEAGINDVDSIAGNKAQGEDDMGSADVIISVKTGAMVTYIGLTTFMIAIIGAGAYMLKRKMDKDNKIEVNF